VIDLQDLLDRRAHMIEPTLDAFARVVVTVRRRHRRRQAMAWGAAMTVLAAALTAIVVARPTPSQRPRIALRSQLLGTKQALTLRTELGIAGPTKGAPQSVIVSERTRSGQVELSLVHVRTGRSTRVRLEADTKNPAVSPKDDVVAAVSHHAVVVTSPEEPARTSVIPETDGAEGQVSWDGSGSVLFTRVKGQWVRVSNAAGGAGLSGARPVVQHVTVPTIPGGPILLSVSPGGTVATLFGITYPHGKPPVPHLYVGRFDGAAVSEPRKIEIPPGALAGPMGWVGENAFLLAPGPGKAIMVRTDGSKIEVVPQGVENPCESLLARIACTSEGPRLLGTNADGSLLFWKVSAERIKGSSAPPILVLYYKTWLDGSHGLRLSGLVGRLGPPVAPR
jgi:hypothetical protein